LQNDKKTSRLEVIVAISHHSHGKLKNLNDVQ